MSNSKGYKTSLNIFQNLPKNNWKLRRSLKKIMKIFIFSQQMLGPSFEIFADKDSFYLQYQLSARYQFICIHEWNSRLSHMVWDFLIWTSDSRPRLARDPWQCKVTFHNSWTIIDPKLFYWLWCNFFAVETYKMLNICLEI